MKIGKRIVNENHRPFIVADIGINHEGSLEKAIRMIDDAYAAGIECVKFQRHIIEDEMLEKEASKTIPGNATESIWEIMKRCSLSPEEVKRLKDYVENRGMIYLCTPFSRRAADELQELGVEAFKIGSGECNNYPLIEHIASFGKPVILSTGMNNLNTINPAVEILEKAKLEYALLHCTSIYPTPYEKVRLNALKELATQFPDAVLGLSDHSKGIYTCLGAVPLGASILEKHFTSDKNWLGPDIPISIDPSEAKDLVIGSRAIWSSLKGGKEILEEEQPTINFAYASVVSTKPIRKGERLSPENSWIKRPGTGEFLAKDYEGLIGRVVREDIPANVQLKRRNIE